MQLNVIDYFEERALVLSPAKTAVIDGDRSIAFSSLAVRAKSLAWHLMQLGDFRNQPVAVFMSKSIESVVSNLAITYSANVYVNLDVKYPASRLLNVLNKIQPKIVITTAEHLDKLAVLEVPGLVLVDVNAVPEGAGYDEQAIRTRRESLIDTDPYCIINTSGSTGTPKGVVLNHKSFIDFTEWAVDTLNIGDNEVIGSLSPLYFDIYSFELCLLMAKSATLVIVQEQLAIFPIKLIEFLNETKINFIFWVPTVMVNIANLDILASIGLPDLKKVLFAGEVFPTKHMNYWRDRLPGAMFVNLYGPIEITLDCTYFIVDRDIPNDQPIPIGFPCRNTDVLILNDENAAAGTNEKGELCVRGTSLAMGYYNDPEKTAKAFVQNPLNTSYPELIYRTGDVVLKNEAGEIIFVGRKDYQVKHLGYRIDLSELEHVILNNWGKVRNACVLYNHSKKDIWLVYEGAQEIAAAVFRKELSEHLPKYMIPTQYLLFGEMPRNPNGKIDRNMLAQMIADEAAK